MNQLLGQMSVFDFLTPDCEEEKPKKVEIGNKRIKLLELFAGYGSQALALEKLGVDFQHHFVCEFDKYAVASYNAVHGTSFDVTDIRNVKGGDLGIKETDKYMYLLTYSFPCT